MTSIGQTYHGLVDTNKLWSVKYQSCESPFPYFDNYFAKFSSDTLIGTLHYKKAFTTSDTTLMNWSHQGFIREDSTKKIFYRNSSGSEGLIYDFAVGVGDTVLIDNTNILDTVVKLVVSSVDSVFIFDKFLKRIVLNHDSINPQYDEIWIDGIGSMNGILHSSRYAIPTVGLCYELLCFTENDTLKYLNPNYNYCFYIVGVDEIKQDKIKVNLYPNPVISTSILSIENLEDNLAALDIFSILGGKIRTITFNKNRQIIINNSDFQSGLYIYRVITKTKIITGKFEIN